MEALAESYPRILDFARRVFAEQEWEDDFGDFLPVWLTPSFVGSGDYPKAYRDKGTAKRVCVNQCRRDGYRTRGFVVERRQERLFLYEVAELTADGFRGRPGCWQPLLSGRLDGLSDWEAPISHGPRTRPSALADRRAA